ncbi:transcriptional regulator, RpiR family [Faunimonas pinastri]|uniref:Transcriptional regulator, RpiR family n=1 Tax=Faunimonas pinastri TaxID=1855383 RepID=A0A1H9B0L6_9HYPH|nr:MurR/RpiR family transcriptional regulator [Faunimonas pinastri]SEP82580.1 transcriptional regulator, RpiR family [Faunimonas pinastri]
MPDPRPVGITRLPAGAVVAERIAAAYPSLSDALKAFADFVLAEPMQVARLSINETVANSGVSVATANRFARTIGFAGYAQFRAELIRGFEPVFAPVERLKQKLSEASSVRDILVASLQEDIRNLQATIHNLDAERCEQAVEMIVAARRIFVIGFDTAGNLAGLLANGLELAGCDVRVVENAGGSAGASRRLFRFDASDLAIAIAFPRYLRDTVELTQYIRSRGIRVLSITDNQNSPIAGLSDLTLYVHTSRQFSSTSDTATLALLEALTAGVASRSPGSAELAEEFSAFAYPWLTPPRHGSNR